MVKLHTNHGVITLELDAAKAPVTVENFLDYVKSGHFNNTVFHRVIDGFMIQGGGFEPGMKQKPTGEQIKNEADNGLKNDKYTVAMARTGDPGWGYCVFGKVTDGADIVDKIKGVKTADKGGHQNVPVEDVIIEKAEVA